MATTCAHCRKAQTDLFKIVLDGYDQVRFCMELEAFLTSPKLDDSGLSEAEDRMCGVLDSLAGADPCETVYCQTCLDALRKEQREEIERYERERGERDYDDRSELEELQLQDASDAYDRVCEETGMDVSAAACALRAQYKEAYERLLRG